MPHTLAREKALFEKLVSAGELALSDAISYFSKKGTKADLKATEIGLRRLMGHNLIEVRTKASGERVSPTSHVLAIPDDYFVAFLGFAESENVMSEVRSGMLGPNVTKIDSDTHLVVIEPQQKTTVDGDLEDVAVLYEQVRAFTHRFAMHIVNRDYELAVGLFASALQMPDALDELRSSIEKREKRDGTYDTFDHVVVGGLYHQFGNRKSPLEEPDIWRGIVDRSTRRGVSTFELGSLVTPGGVILDGCFMALSIVEEEGRLCVHRYELYSGG